MRDGKTYTFSVLYSPENLMNDDDTLSEKFPFRQSRRFARAHPQLISLLQQRHMIITELVVGPAGLEPTTPAV